MFARFGIPAIVVIGAAWALVQPDTPRPEAIAEIEAPSAVETGTGAGSAIELLGEAWTVNAPEPTEPPAPLVRPLTAAEHAAAIAALRRGETATTSGPEDRAQVAAMRRPVPRPVARSASVYEAPVTPPAERVVPTVTAADPGTIVVTAPAGSDWDAPPPVIRLRGGAVPEVARADTGARWVVRRQGSGDIIAEVPLADALAILSSR